MKWAGAPVLETIARVTGTPAGPASVAASATRRRAALAWAVLVVLYLLVRVPGLLANSATYDEPIYIGAAKHFALLRDDRAAAMLYHPTLSYHLMDLPLWFLDTPLRAWDPAGANTQVGLDVLYASTFRGAPVAPETVLLLARLPILLVGLLGIPFLFALGRRLGGAAAGWLSAIAWAAFPEAAAQSIQATTDCVAAVAALGLAVATLRYVDAVRDATATERRRRTALVVLGLATGLALLAKHTLLVHVAVVAVALWVLRTMTVRRFLAAAGIAAFVVWAGYLFEFRTPLPPTGPHETLDHVAHAFGIAPSVLEGPARAIPFPAPTYVRSVADALFSKATARAGTPWTAYMGGEWSTKGFWLYFPYATLVKTPAALLGLVLLGLFGLRRVLAESRGAALLVAALCVVPFAAAVTSRLNIGFRHLLPTLPFLFVLGIAGLVRLRGALDTRALWLLSFLLTVESLHGPRDPIPFANVLAGGPADLHLHLADSNLEVGQDLGRVSAWAREHDVRKITCFLHGPPGLFERECARNPVFEALDEAPTGGTLWLMKAEDQKGEIPKDRLIAVGESVMLTPRWRRWLLDMPPLAQVGRTRIYALSR